MLASRAAVASETASALRAARGAVATLTGAAAGAIFVVFTEFVGTLLSALAAATCRPLPGMDSHSATAATPSSAAVPTAAMTRCAFDCTFCQKDGRTSYPNCIVKRCRSGVPKLKGSFTQTTSN
jgi:hypothetical protein